MTILFDSRVRCEGNVWCRSSSGDGRPVFPSEVTLRCGFLPVDVSRVSKEKSDLESVCLSLKITYKDFYFRLTRNEHTSFYRLNVKSLREPYSI